MDEQVVEPATRRVLLVNHLATRLGLAGQDQSHAARIVEMEHRTHGICSLDDGFHAAAEAERGLRVDGASEVLRFSGAEIELPNAAAQRGPRRSVRGIAKLSERLILLLDLDQILGESSSWLSSSSAGERKGAG